MVFQTISETGLDAILLSRSSEISNQIKASHRWFESRMVQQGPAEIQTIYAQADCSQVDSLSTSMTDFYM